MHFGDMFGIVERQEFAATSIFHAERPFACEVPERTSHFHGSPPGIGGPAHSICLRFWIRKVNIIFVLFLLTSSILYWYA